MCHREEPYQELNTQEKIIGQLYDPNQLMTIFQTQPQGECTFMNFQQGAYCHVNHGGNDSIANNTISKRRAIEEATPPRANQASTSRSTPHAPVANKQLDIRAQQRQNPSNKRPK